VVVSINRLSDVTIGYALPNQFLRWTEVANLLLGLAAVLIYRQLPRSDLIACRRSLRPGDYVRAYR